MVVVTALHSSESMPHTGPTVDTSVATAGSTMSTAHLMTWYAFSGMM